MVVPGVEQLTVNLVFRRVYLFLVTRGGSDRQSGDNED